MYQCDQLIMANTSINMSASLGITSTEPRELKLGASFANQGPLFHTLRYDFKPASVDVHKVATVEVNEKNEVMVTVPHNDGAGTPHTVFKGNQCPTKRDCVLIINKSTGEMTIEKLHSSITVKKTRFEAVSKLAPPLPEPVTLGRKPSPKHREGRGRASPKPSSLGCIPKHSPLHASPNPNLPPSLPMIGEDIDYGYDEVKHEGENTEASKPPSRIYEDVKPPEREVIHKPVKNAPAVSKRPPTKKSMMHDRDMGMTMPIKPPPPKQPSPEISFSFESIDPPPPPPPPPLPIVVEERKPIVEDLSMLMNDDIGVLSDSTSGSDSDSSSDSSSEPDNQPTTAKRAVEQGASNGTSFQPSAQVLLSDDLQLSDSGSDSD